MVKHKLVITLLLISVIFNSLFLLTSIYAQQENNGWKDFDKWYEWKKQQKLAPQQKELISYLDIAGSLFDKAEDTWSFSKKHPQLPEPRKALAIVNQCIEQLSRLKVPNVAIKYNDAVLATLNIIMRYHTMRLSTRNEDILSKITLESLKYDGVIFSESFKMLKDVGLFDNIDNEMMDLGLIDRAEFDKTFNYYQEIDKGSLPKCPKCNTVMRKVPIVYDQSKLDKAPTERVLNFLPGSEEDYPNKPKFGYICDKDNQWFEEYPSNHPGKAIIRNWGWGFYNARKYNQDKILEKGNK